MKEEEYVPLFETRQAKRRFIYRIFATSVFVAICMVWVYRITNIPSRGEDGRWAWIGLFCAELWFGFYWILTQVPRWNPVYRYTFKDRLSLRYESCLPKVDIFVCTADPVIEPPIMVVNTVLSVMAYDYPPEKLSIYLSDDGCSILTYYALFEASNFSKHWLPYCRKYNVEPRSPAAYFSSLSDNELVNTNHSSDLASIKELYEEMSCRIENSTKLSRVPEDVQSQHKGFSQWLSSYTSKHDHDTILQILVDGRHLEAKDIEGCTLPTLVYLAREKRPQCFHNFKAGALNALIRVSSKISNGPVILNVDCDMYSNNSQSMRDALCFFMDEKKSHNIAYVQFPQNFEYVTKNDLYGASMRVAYDVELEGMDALGGSCYIGTGCFHQRDILCGKKYHSENKIDWKTENASTNDIQRPMEELEELAKTFASCTYEINSQWGKEISSPWILVFVYIIVGKYSYSLGEFLYFGGTALGWWNEQRMWLYKRTSSYLFAFIDTFVKVLGISNMKFVISSKVADEDVSQRYEKEIMEFGVTSPMFVILEILALMNLFTLIVATKKMQYDMEAKVIDRLGLQFLLSAVLVLVNLPLYKGILIRKDKGKVPTSATIKATFIALSICTCFMIS